MKYLTLLKQSLKAIFTNKGRSFLTTLGIIIGIGSVIALVALGNGVQASVSGQISKLGATNLTITPGQRLAQAEAGPAAQRNVNQSNRGADFGGTTSTLSETDLKSLSDTAAHSAIEAVTGTVSGSALFTVNGVEERDSISGTNPEYFSIHELAIKSGRLFTQADIDAKAKVIVLGSTLAGNILPNQEAVGKTLLLQNDTYTVVGVLAAGAESSFLNPNLNGYVPYSSAMLTFNATTFGTMMVQAKNENSVDAAKADIEKTLLANHKITEVKLADFSVLSSKDLLSTIGNVTGLLTSLLSGIAAISLVVGGIGIMNIMLVAVTERTREIGLRKAVGARTSDILIQFIIEAIILTLAGGILGIGLGALVAKVAGRFIGFAPVVTTASILLAVGVSSAVGLVFGIYPAAKAARLNPIDALRYE